jgi:diguanylate cyclase (GGDEF)-like protein
MNTASFLNLADHISPLQKSLLLQRAAEDAKRAWKEAPENLQTSKDGLWRLLSATLAILNHTSSELDRAKERLTFQTDRIEQLEKLLTLDELTGLHNRRGFDQQFEKELDRTKRGLSMGGVLLVIDLDNFKSINDTFGHLAGDACLKAVGDYLKTEIRTMDTASRLGGDEFVLLLTNTQRHEVLARTQEIAWKLNHLTLNWNGELISIRASVGIKDYCANDNEAKSIFAAADEALYADKSARRDISIPAH